MNYAIRACDCAYQLDELLLAAICAVISGAESWTSVVEWSEMKLDWLRQHRPFANGIASHDTFGRVFSLLDAKQFEACFVRWMSVLCPSLEGQHIAIDGNCVRGHRTMANRAPFIWCRRGAARAA